jgi:tight adherence protein B
VTGWALLASSLVALAVAIWTPVRRPPTSVVTTRGQGYLLTWLAWIVGPCAALLLVGWGGADLTSQLPVLLVGALPVALVVRHLVRKHRRRAAAARRSQQVLELCDALAAELYAGLPLAAALERACRPWPELATVVVTSHLQGDVVGALRQAAERGGAGGLRAVAAAVEVAHGSGASLARVLERTAETLRHEADARAELAAALGPPRATARMLMLLPLFGLALGASMGAHPIAFLLGSLVGMGCLLGGVLLSLLGLLWVERIADGAT